MANSITSRSVLPWWRRALGEISALRGSLTSWVAAGGAYAPYSLDSSRVDYGLARALYSNTHDKYKLGAAFARPIINTCAGFMGVPAFTHPDPEASAALEDMADRWSGRLLRLTRNALRDGDAYARIVYTNHPLNPKKRLWDLMLIPPEWVLPILDPLTGRIASVVVRRPVKLTDPNGSETANYTVTETIDSANVTLTVTGQAPEAVRAQAGTRENPWGFVPVVHFRNEAEEYQLYGASDLEPVEPFMRAYHDVMLHAIAGSKLFSTPKVKFKLKNVSKFLGDNFSSDEVRTAMAGGGLRFANRDVYLMGEGDDVAFISADSGAAGATALLELLFCCIVDVSETPEFAFGTAVASSKASVSEQMVPLTRKIERKRGQFAEHFAELASMFVAMWERVEARNLDDYQVGLEWPEVSEKDETRMSTVISTLVQAMATGVESKVLSLTTAIETLREHLPALLPLEDRDGDDDELRRLEATQLILARLSDSEGFGGQPDGSPRDDGRVESLAEQIRQMRRQRMRRAGQPPGEDDDSPV